jgi:aminomethyltransferase
VGKVTSAVYSPRLKKNIALAMVDIEYANINSELSVEIEGSLINSIVVEKPFFDPKKQITTSN